MYHFLLFWFERLLGSNGSSGGVPSWRIRRIDAKIEMLLDHFEIHHRPQDSFEQFARLVREGRKIDAIRLYRQETGASLVEAKTAIEGGTAASTTSDLEHKVDLLLAKFGVTHGDDTDDEIAEMARSGRKIEAMRLYRERTGTGLAEAKAAVEGLMARSIKP